ncbi:hypothetical protein QU487_17240 [Crenobacter sp. SG2305]|uniref:hypothetical protein n=1 Tax=Crenobacter oryzisoli TaxID=3056844 RepID=UPI0025AA6A6D|nr:hypothetical protein [Crenobacter sp. SG2305]MDN0084484.1 hypothetical protein [Crenobacter sp. SG2305]
MDTPDEIARDNWYSDLVDEISIQAIDEFTLDRLRSYYVTNKSLASNVVSIYKEAETLLDKSPSAALVLFTTAIEVGLKVTLLKPVVYGLVHNESVADLVSDLAIKQNGFDRFKPILAKIIKEYGNIDFNNFKIKDHIKTIWEEIYTLQIVRNGVVHRGELASAEKAILAKDVATMIMGVFLPSVLKNLGLKIVNGGKIENV